MTRYVVRRVGQALLALFGVSIVVFALIHLVPGDPVRTALGTRFDQDLYDALVARAGLDQPVLVQYVRWLGNALQGDLGVSFRTGQPVTTALTARLPATALLAFGALLVGLIIALPAGIVSAVRQGKLADYVANGFAQVGVSVPDPLFGGVRGVRPDRSGPAGHPSREPRRLSAARTGRAGGRAVGPPRRVGARTGEWGMSGCGEPVASALPRVGACVPLPNRKGPT